MSRRQLIGSLSLVSGIVALAAGCSSDTTPAQGTAGSPGSPVGAAGSASSAGSGATVGGSGSNTAGGPGVGGSGGVGGTGAGVGGTGAGGTGAGAGGTGVGVGGTGAGVGGTGGGAGGTSAGAGGTGAGGTGAGGPYDVPRGPSMGCGKPNTTDEPGAWTSHNIEVTGVDTAYWGVVKKVDAGSGPYTFTNRTYAVRPPQDYDPAKKYPLVFTGGGCGNTNGMSGATGGNSMVPNSALSEAFTVGLSYVYPQGAGACFGDEYENSYEVPYWDSVYKKVTEDFCIDLEKVFIGGYSSGAWMSYTVGFARGGKVRGIGPGAGGIREKRPVGSTLPFAAMMVTGAQDGGNPVHKTKDGTTCAGTEAQGCWNGKTICGFPGATDCYDTGSAHARDVILMRNGCVGTETTQYKNFPACKQYTGCPAAFPVVYCMPDGGHTEGGEMHNPGTWEFWKALPAVP